MLADVFENVEKWRMRLCRQLSDNKILPDLPRAVLYTASLTQTVVDVLDNIVDVFQTNRNPDQCGCNAGGCFIFL